MKVVTKKIENKKRLEDIRNKFRNLDSYLDEKSFGIETFSFREGEIEMVCSQDVLIVTAPDNISNTPEFNELLSNIEREVY